MSARIKRMLREREQVKAAAARAPDFEANGALLDMIDKAAPFIDEGMAQNKWPPSAKLKIIYFIMATGPAGPKRGTALVLKLLDRARARFVAGLHPNPFLGDPGDTQK